MKPKPTGRNVQSHDLRQSDRSANLGRVARVRQMRPSSDEVVRSGRTPRSGDSSSGLAARRKVVMWVWSVALVAVSVLIIGVFMLFWLRSRKSQDGDPSSAANAANEDQIRVLSKFNSPTETEALDLVKRALAVRDPGKVGSMFRLGEAGADEVVSFLSTSGERDGKLDRMDWLSSMDVSGQQADGVLVVYAGKERAIERLAFLVPDDAGVWKVDFESFARTSRPKWSDLTDGRAERARVRVLVGRDAYFNGPYLDENRWMCYGMVSADANGMKSEDILLLHGYCRVNSPQAKALEKIFSMGNRTTRATLELRRTEGAESKQFEISRVLSEDWVLSPKPYDERF